MATLEDEEILYAEGYGEEFGKYQHLDLEPEHLEEESILTEYDGDDFVSCAVISPGSSLPIDLFDFEHSYGYDCKKFFNLCACDETVVCWCSGSIITFFDTSTKQTWFRRSTTGGSVGNICSYREDPNYRIAIAEAREGNNEPVIVLYLWPQMEIDAVLREGTENAYAILDFSPDGELLASVGSAPDYNITIWNWKRHKIMLRTSAFTHHVYNVMFSPYCPGQLTTAGSAHIKFWKMVQTFTGLKLKGELGRFGKTEICDVLGVYPMPDEKVLSGCSWGNILVWEAGLVKLEVTQRARKRCHGGPIIQFMLSPACDEVTTISQDGCIRAWYWDTVEQADPPEDDQYVELNPVAETCVPDCKIMCLKHQKDMFWFAQDGNGGIWTVDIELDKIECKHTKLLTRHAGSVASIVMMRTHPLLVTGGEDGAIMVFNTETHALMVRYLFPAPVSYMLNAPLEIDITSRIMIVGFADGVMRTLLIHPDRILDQKEMVEVRVHSTLTIHSADSENPDVIDMISWLKPHHKKINQITINSQRSLLVTCGEDSTIFMYKITKGQPAKPFTLERIGFCETPQVITYATWKYEEERVILLCGRLGLIMEAVLPDAQPRVYSEITTFLLEFESTVEMYLKKQVLRNRPFPTEDDLASIDEEALKAAAEIEEKDEDEEGWVGEIQLLEMEKEPGPTILWAQYCDEGIRVTQNGTGAILYLKISNKPMPPGKTITKYAPIPGAWLDDMTVIKFICESRYVIMGTSNGYIRVLRMPTEEEDNPDYHFVKWRTNQKNLLKELKGRRLAEEEKEPTPQLDLIDNYYLQMHDRATGQITDMTFNGDGTQFFTSGGDGNIFSYNVNFAEPFFPPPELPEGPDLPKVEKVPEPSTVEGVIMSHEQLKQKEEYDKMMATANAHKKRVRDQLAELTVDYNQLIKLNRMLPCSQQIDVTLDPRPLTVQDTELEEAKALTIRKIAHQLESSDIGLFKMYSRNIIQLDVFPFTLRAIQDPKDTIRPLRQKNLPPSFHTQLQEVYEKMREAAMRARRTDEISRRVASKKMSWGPPKVASFLLGLPPNPPHPLKKQLRNYYVRLHRHHLQFIEWQEHLSRKPDPNALPPGAAEALKEAEATIGNFVLKTDPDYVAPAGHNTQLRLCQTRQQIYENKHAFNMKVVELRQYKVKLIERAEAIGERLAEIRVEIPHALAKPPPIVPEIDEELEFPEHNLEVKSEQTRPMKSTVALARRGSLPGGDRKSQVQLLYPQPRIRQPKVPPFISLWASKPLAASWDVLKPKPDDPATALEEEVRNRRIERHLFEQDMLLQEANEDIHKFDSRLRELQRERIRVQEKNQLMQLHLYQLHQEMNVLNRFEADEDRLAERVYSKLMEVRAVQEQIRDCEQLIEELYSEKEALGTQCDEIQRQFKKLVQDYKFADFLRRIFKKKYRAPRVLDDDESSEESSSSSSSEEEEGSYDSRDIGPIRLDPNICPEGCDREIYDKTYELRGNRHRFEQEMIEKDRMADGLRREIDAHNKVKRKLSIQLDKRKKTLKEFMMEKQSCLNEIDQTVVLRYDQMRARAIYGCTTGPEGLKNTVVFPEQLFEKLRNRVLELQNEIKQARLRAKINRTHLFRMNIDLREMKRLAEDYRAQMRDILTRKLGKPRKVDKTLDDLLRQMARRHKYSVNLKIMPHVIAQFRKYKERQSELDQEYLRMLNKYSERLRLAAALQSDVLPQKPPKDPAQMVGGYNLSHYQRDVCRLRIIQSQQAQQIRQVQAAINALKYPGKEELKSMPQAPLKEPSSELWLYMIRPIPYRSRRKYFPITPLGSQHNMLYDVNTIKLLYDALDSMRISRDDAELLLKDLTEGLPDIISGEKSRFEVVDNLLKKWMLKHGGDPTQYKKQTRAFDALATLAERLIKQHMETLEGAMEEESNAVQDQLETALKGVVEPTEETLGARLAPMIAALFHMAETQDLATEETMTSLVNSLIDDEHPLIEQEILDINTGNVVQNIIDLGVTAPMDDIERIVLLSVECLKAQLVSPEEAQKLSEEVEKAIVAASQAITLKGLRPDRTSISTTNIDSHRTSRSELHIGTRPSITKTVVEPTGTVAEEYADTLGWDVRTSKHDSVTSKSGVPGKAEESTKPSSSRHASMTSKSGVPGKAEESTKPSSSRHASMTSKSGVPGKAEESTKPSSSRHASMTSKSGVSGKPGESIKLSSSRHGSVLSKSGVSGKAEESIKPTSSKRSSVTSKTGSFTKVSSSPVHTGSIITQPPDLALSSEPTADGLSPDYGNTTDDWATTTEDEGEGDET